MALGLMPLGLNPKNGAVIKVMIVDDSKTIRLLLKQILLSEKFEIAEEAEDGEDAIAKLGALPEKPDIYFSDIEMPKLNGLEAVKQVKPLLPRGKIVMVTSVNDQQRVKEAISLGIDGYIVKPGSDSVGRKEFLEKLAAILKRDDYQPKALA
jgi:two-component system chemotaxis response regulator CheY